MNTLKSQIEKLYNEGKTYREISKILGCSKGTISYHVGYDQKSKNNARQSTSRQKHMLYFKELHGGKCACCDYDRNYSALDFHHLDPNLKNREMTSLGRLMTAKGLKIAEEETNKCILLCSNCHREVHDGTILIVMED